MFSAKANRKKKSYVFKQDFLIGNTGIFKDIKSPLIFTEDIESSLVYFYCFQLMPGSITRDKWLPKISSQTSMFINISVTIITWHKT